MSRILLVDDSPHAQRMGERILSDEGYEVVTVSNSDSALIRLDDVDPDVVIADTVMPGRTGFEICQYLKMSPRHRHVRVILTAGVLETLDEAQVKRVESDGTLRKPFEATALLAAVKPLAEAAAVDRAEVASLTGSSKGKGPADKGVSPVVPFVAVVDSEQVRAAVTVALDASMELIVDEITNRVLAALNTRKSTHTPESAPARPEPPHPIAPPPAPTPSPSNVEPVRRITPVKTRAGSILGLELSPSDSDAPVSERRPLRPAGGERVPSNPLTALPSRFPRLASDSRFPGATAPGVKPVTRIKDTGPETDSHSPAEPDPLE